MADPKMSTVLRRGFLAPEITQRGTVLPFAKYDDGSTSLAVPNAIYAPASIAGNLLYGMAASLSPYGARDDGSTGARIPPIVTEPYQAFYRLMSTGYDINADPGAKRQAIEDAFLVSGAAMTGGGAATVLGKGAPRNSLGSAGGRLVDDAIKANSLPMDVESRMARAREMGFDTSRKLYHGTGRDFDRFEPSGPRESLGSGVYTSDLARDANDYAVVEVFDPATNRYSVDPGMVYPLYARGKLFKYDGDNLPETLARVEEILPGASRGATKWSLGRNSQAFANALKDAGYAGIDHSWHEGRARFNQVNIFDPANIRSVNAAFDPSESASSNILYANGGKSGGATGTGINALAASERPGIRAYHGSPHDFDRFDMSKVGTGEGAQSYGHGLYFTENPVVADNYKRELGGAGRTYEVSINADPERFIDWDKPLSQQSAEARAALSEMGLPDDASGYRIYQAIAGKLASEGKIKSGGDLSSLVASTLKDAGIPGVRYLDGGSRLTGEDAHNYVVFDDSLIDILRKYGLAGMLGGGGYFAQDGEPSMSNTLRRGSGF
jgi:hypothetical protein